MNAVSSALHRDDPAQPRGDWTRAEIRALFELPFPELMFRAQDIHRRAFDPTKVQLSTLLSIKTGGCPEDCAYCPQSAHYKTGVERHELLPLDETLAAAQEAKQRGATRFCMGAAWRDIPEGPRFERVLELVRGDRKSTRLNSSH